MSVNFVPFRDEPMMGRGDLSDQWSVWHGNIKMTVEISKGTQFYSEFVASRNYLVSSCRTPKKLSFNVSLHLTHHPDQGSRLAAQMKIKYAEEYSIRQVAEIFKD